MSSWRRKISCGLFPKIKACPASVNAILGFRSTNPKAFGARFILSRALNALSEGDPVPSKKLLSASSSINCSCVVLFHGLPWNLSQSNSISGIIFAGVRGEVVKNKTLLSSLAIPATSIVFYYDMHLIVLETISNIYSVVLVILIKNEITIQFFS